MKKFFFLAFITSSFVFTSCSTTYLAFKNSKQNGSSGIKEVYDNGKSQLVSSQPESVVVLSCEKVPVGAPEITALLSVLLTNGNEEIIFDPSAITATATMEGKKGDVEVGLIVQDPDRYALKQEKVAKRAATWAAIANGMSAASNQMNMNQAGSQYNTAGVNASAIQQQNLKESAAKNEQNLKDNLANISTSSNEFIRTTTLNGNMNQIGGKIVFFPQKGKVENYAFITIRVPVGNEVHKFTLNTSTFKL